MQMILVYLMKMIRYVRGTMNVLSKRTIALGFNKYTRNRLKQTRGGRYGFFPKLIKTVEGLIFSQVTLARARTSESDENPTRKYISSEWKSPD